jgi:RNA polymerase sigma-70 factor (ECF subfamily)
MSMTMTSTLERRPTWDEVVDAHSARVYRLAYRLTGNRADAEDLTQDVFVRTFNSLESFTPSGRPGALEAWLTRVTTNLFLDGARRRSRIRFDLVGDETDVRLAGRVAGSDQPMLDHALDDDVEQALQALAPDYRAAVVLCDMEGLTYDEVALALGVKIGTVRSRIHRGRAQLRRRLAHRAPRAGRLRYSGPRDLLPGH